MDFNSSQYGQNKTKNETKDYSIHFSSQTNAAEEMLSLLLPGEGAFFATKKPVMLF